jgi:tRNA (guanine37-N1)-methyltransferase
MRIDIISVLPELLESPLSHSILKRAQTKGLLEVHVVNLRTFSPFQKQAGRRLPIRRRSRHGDDV